MSEEQSIANLNLKFQSEQIKILQTITRQSRVKTFEKL